MSGFNLLPKPTSMLAQIRMDQDDLSLDSTGSERKESPLELSAGPRLKHPKKDNRDFGYLNNSDLVIPQPRKSSQNSLSNMSSPPEPRGLSMMPKLFDIK